MVKKNSTDAVATSGIARAHSDNHYGIVYACMCPPIHQGLSIFFAIRAYMCSWSIVSLCARMLAPLESGLAVVDLNPHQTKTVFVGQMTHTHYDKQCS